MQAWSWRRLAHMWPGVRSCLSAWSLIRVFHSLYAALEDYVPTCSKLFPLYVTVYDFTHIITSLLVRPFWLCCAC